MSEKVKKIESIKIVLTTELSPPKKLDFQKINSFGNHKVFLGYLNAFYNHCPIKLSPNVIWQLILNAFSKYVEKNPEKLRNKFVSFEGKKVLSFERVGTFNDVDKYKEGIVEELCEKISEYVGKELIENLTPNFSTSTKDTIIAGKVSIMSAFKSYFTYHGAMAVCGIPYIILEGTLEDWEKILKKLIYLSKYGFSSYSSLMQKDIEEIINTKKGKINYDFWRKIIMETKEKIMERKGCLKPKEVEKDIIKGWICDFYPYLETLKLHKENLTKLEEEVLTVLIKIKKIGGIKKVIKNAVIYTGITDLKQEPNTFIVEPIVNYYLSMDDEENKAYIEHMKEDEEIEEEEEL